MKFNMGALSDLVFEHQNTPAPETHVTPAPAPARPVAMTQIPSGAVDATHVTDFVTKLRAKLVASPTSATIQSFLTIAESLATQFQMKVVVFVLH